MKALPVVAMLALVLTACSAQEKSDIKDGARTVGHTARDVTRETGHFFRDLFSGDESASQ
ncbi:hypothetical protein VST7929_00212 [Vibrio stylophorae]|uniref:Uncharacterized protein n=1 Tax=Vibrio stylophorae TaxID=659351 RepID=A0ABM8ZQ00_9VIBR|nr:hypothetical protein [Vibrio stylophorae]CAH0532383.1 hypothetical protein VST7929_00212 [Vibrio stylophorae]